MNTQAKKTWRLGDDGVRVGAFFVILGIFALINPTVLSLVNLFAIVNNACFIGVMTMGLMIVMITGNLDLSLASIGLTSAFSTIMLYQAWGWEEGGMYLMFVIAGAAGAVCGLINGFFVYKLGIPGIIVSLGMGQVYNTLLLILTGVTYIPVLPEGMRRLNRTFILQVETALGTAGICFAVLIFAAAVLLVWFVLNKTMVGRGIYALGGDKVAAARVGFNIPLLYGTAYGIMGMLAGMAGMMFYANNTLFQSDWILVEQGNATAAAIFGGVIMKNGKGTVGGVVVGILLIGLIQNNLYLIGIPSYAQKVVVGFIILTSVAMASFNQLREWGKSR
ncbi:MAG: ABC transporter permease [Synergistaceae bacterium]|jgi:simple sugar transport system permease protein|nr:ABC transporter permease [Synergistaceae bacterium]